MGYYMSQVDGLFTIKAEYKNKALEAIKAMFEPERLKNEAQGGGWNAGKKTSSWYSWIDTERSLACKTLEAAIKEWGWEVETDPDESGDIINVYFPENKQGQENLMFKAIAPFVEAGSFLHMMGEDSNQWRWFFDGEKMIEQYPEAIMWK